MWDVTLDYYGRQTNMADLILNGSTYSGNPNGGTLWRPVSVEETINKIATVIVAESGARTLVYRGVKRTWAIKWEGVPESTRSALAALAALATSFSYTDEHGTAYTVQTETDDYKSETSHTTPANVYYYNVDLTIHQV